MSAVYGLPHEQAPRTSGEFLQLIHPDDRERADRLLGALLESGREIEYEFRAMVGDRIVWIYDRSTLVRDAAGRPSYMTGACLDVTARKQIEEERNVANEKYRLLLRELHHRVTNHLQMIMHRPAMRCRATQAHPRPGGAARPDRQRAGDQWGEVRFSRRPARQGCRANAGRGNDAILTVADDGVGLRGTDEAAGTGLGLTWCAGWRNRFAAFSPWRMTAARG